MNGDGLCLILIPRNFLITLGIAACFLLLEVGSFFESMMSFSPGSHRTALIIRPQFPLLNCPSLPVFSVMVSLRVSALVFFLTYSVLGGS